MMIARALREQVQLTSESITAISASVYVLRKKDEELYRLDFKGATDGLIR